MKDVCIIGGGAAGMMAGIAAARKGLSVTLIERNEKLGKKLYITGKGRCNITNDCDFDTLCSSVVKNVKFLYGAFRGFMPSDTISFFEELGLHVKTERGNRVFPVSDKSSDVIKALEKELRHRGVEILLSQRVKGLLINESEGVNVCTGVRLSDGSRVHAAAVVVATGGLSYPSTGSDGDGYRFAGEAGLNVTDLKPGLVPMCIRESFVKDMQGLSLKNVGVSFSDPAGGKILYKDFGEMIFTHFGVSGPIILSAASVLGDMIKEKPLRLEIDFKPVLEHKQLDRRIIKELETNNKKSFRNMLKNLLPMTAIPVVAGMVTDNPDKKCYEISAGERKVFKNIMKAFPMTVTGLRGFDEAVITRGGVDVKEIDPKTFEAKKVKGLYFIGEVLDTDALTGGFNLQIAWSTAVRCAGEMGE